MARMYFHFATNLPDSTDDKPTMQVESITFRSPDGIIFIVDCEGDSEFGVKDGVYCCRFKGLEYFASREDGDEVLNDWGYVPDDELLSSLCKSTVVGVNFYWEEGSSLPGNGEKPTCRDLKVEIEQTSPTDSEEIYHMKFHEDNPGTTLQLSMYKRI